MGSEPTGPQVRLAGFPSHNSYDVDMATYDQYPAGMPDDERFWASDVRVALAGGRRALVHLREPPPGHPERDVQVWSNQVSLDPKCYRYDAAKRRLTIFADRASCLAHLLADLVAGAVRLGPEFARYVTRANTHGCTPGRDRATGALRVFHMRGANTARRYTCGEAPSDDLAQAEATRFPLWVSGIEAGLDWLDARPAPQVSTR